MDLMKNPTVKTALIVGALTLGAAALFVGTEDSEGVLGQAAEKPSAETVDLGAAEAGPGGPGLSGNSEQAQSSDNDFDESQVTEFEDEDFIDNTEGFDPNPVGDDTDFSSDDGGSGAFEDGVSGDIGPIEGLPPEGQDEFGAAE